MKFVKWGLLFALISCSQYSLAKGKELEAKAKLISTEETTISAPFSAEIKSIDILQDKHFKKGETLFSLNCTVQKIRLKEVESKLEAKKEEYKSTLTLKKYKSASKLELANAKAALEEAKAKKAHLAHELDQCTFKAPYSGVVVKRSADPHEYKRIGEPILELANTNKLEALMFVPSSWLAWLKPKTTFKICFHEINKCEAVVVDRIGGTIDTASRTVNIFGHLKDSNKNLIPGMSGIAYFKRA